MFHHKVRPFQMDTATRTSETASAFVSSRHVAPDVTPTTEERGTTTESGSRKGARQSVPRSHAAAGKESLADSSYHPNSGVWDSEKGAKPSTRVIRTASHLATGAQHRTGSSTAASPWDSSEEDGANRIVRRRTTTTSTSMGGGVSRSWRKEDTLCEFEQQEGTRAPLYTDATPTRFSTDLSFTIPSTPHDAAMEPPYREAAHGEQAAMDALVPHPSQHTFPSRARATQQNATSLENRILQQSETLRHPLRWEALHTLYQEQWCRELCTQVNAYVAAFRAAVGDLESVVPPSSCAPPSYAMSSPQATHASHASTDTEEMQTIHRALVRHLAQQVARGEGEGEGAVVAPAVGVAVRSLSGCALLAFVEEMFLRMTRSIRHDLTALEHKLLHSTAKEAHAWAAAERDNNQEKDSVGRMGSDVLPEGADQRHASSLRALISSAPSVDKLRRIEDARIASQRLLDSMSSDRMRAEATERAYHSGLQAALTVLEAHLNVRRRRRVAAVSTSRNNPNITTNNKTRNPEEDMHATALVSGVGGESVSSFAFWQAQAARDESERGKKLASLLHLLGTREQTMHSITEHWDTNAQNLGLLPTMDAVGSILHKVEDAHGYLQRAVHALQRQPLGSLAVPILVDHYGGSGSSKHPSATGVLSGSSGLPPPPPTPITSDGDGSGKAAASAAALEAAATKPVLCKGRGVPYMSLAQRLGALRLQCERSLKSLRHCTQAAEEWRDQPAQYVLLDPQRGSGKEMMNRYHKALQLQGK